jgi:ferredoxin
MGMFSPVTKRLFSEEHRAGSSVIRATHAYVYLRWIKQYVYVARNYLIPILPRFLKTWLKDNYHSKVITQREAEDIVRFEGQIDLHEISDQVIPFPTIRDMVLKEHTVIAALSCSCRDAFEEEGGTPCEPRKVCMIMGEPFVSFAIEKHRDGVLSDEEYAALLTRDGEADLGGVLVMTPERAVGFLQEQHDLGRVHAAWFKDATMGRFYAICNCCSCCCSGTKAMKQWGTPIVAGSGYLTQIDSGPCDGCGVCVDKCVYDALEIDESGKAVHVLDAEGHETCMGCGVCVSHCPQSCMSLELPSDPKTLPFEVRLLEAAQHVDLGGDSDEGVVSEVLGKMGVRPEDEADFRKRYGLSPRQGTPPRT